MWKQRLANLSIALVLSLSALAVVPASVWAVADTCTWTGATDANWGTASNWSCTVDGAAAPENGDTLVFPGAASNKAMNNDLVGLIIDNIGVGGSGYTFGGNGFTISGVSALDATASVVVNAPVTFSGFNAVIAATAGNTITFNGVTTFASGGGEVNVGISGYDGTVDFVGNIQGSAATQFVAVEGAKAIVRGGANTFTASTVGAETGATFECRSTSCFGDVANDIYMGDGTVSILNPGVYPYDWQTSVPSPGNSWLTTTQTISITGNGTVNDLLGISQNGTGQNMQFTGSVTLNTSVSLFTADSSAAVNFDAGTITGTGGFSIGSGTFRLGGINSFTGTNTINSGAVVTITHEDSLGSASGITNVLNGGVLKLDFGVPGTINEPLFVSGSGQANSGALVFIGDDATVNGDITLDGDTTFTIDSPVDGQPTLQGTISGAHNLTYQQGAGLYGFVLNSPNSYTGTTTINGTFVRASATNAIPSQDVYVNATATSDAELELWSNDLASDTQRVHTANNGANIAYLSFTANETIAQVDGDGEIQVFGTNVLNTAGNYTFSGNLHFVLGTSILQKSGTGTATLSGTASAQAGATPLVEVGGGTLIANGSYSLVDFTVNSGGTLKGTGSLGATTVNAGGTLAAGTSPGCITTEALTLSAGSTFQQEITGTTACSQYDRTTVNGAVNLGGATLQVSQLAGFNPAANLVFTIIDGTSLTGTFAGLADGAVFAVNGVNYRINYYATGEVTLTVVTAPATATTPTNTLLSTGTGTSVITAISLVLMGAATVTMFANRTRLARAVRRIGRK